MNRSESTFCLSFINHNKNDDCIKQLVLTVGKPLSTGQTSDRRYIYSLWVRYIGTIYIYVIFMVYSDEIRVRYIYGFYLSSKKLSYIPKKYLKYNVRKGMVGRSEDVPWMFECLVGCANPAIAIKAGFTTCPSVHLPFIIEYFEIKILANTAKQVSNLPLKFTQCLRKSSFFFETPDSLRLANT